MRRGRRSPARPILTTLAAVVVACVGALAGATSAHAAFNIDVEFQIHGSETTYTTAYGTVTEETTPGGILVFTVRVRNSSFVKTQYNVHLDLVTSSESITTAQLKPKMLAGGLFSGAPGIFGTNVTNAALSDGGAYTLPIPAHGQQTYTLQFTMPRLSPADPTEQVEALFTLRDKNRNPLMQVAGLGQIDTTTLNPGLNLSVSTSGQPLVRAIPHGTSPYFISATPVAIDGTAEYQVGLTNNESAPTSMTFYMIEFPGALDISCDGPSTFRIVATTGNTDITSSALRRGDLSTSYTTPVLAVHQTMRITIAVSPLDIINDCFNDELEVTAHDGFGDHAYIDLLTDRSTFRG